MKVNNLKLSKTAVQKLEQKFLLREGKIIKAEVVQLAGKKITLKIGTTLINAETKVPLTKGESLSLLVESVRKNFITLKIVPKGEMVKPESIILSRLGLTPERTLENIVGELTKYKMPVTLEVLKEVASTLKYYNLPKEILSLLIWLKSTGINVSTKEDVLELNNFQKFLQGKLSEKEEMRFTNLLNKLESTILGGYNIYSWPLNEHKLYLFTSGSKPGKKHPGNCILLLRLKSSILGDLWFKIIYQKNNLDLTVICEKREYKKILQNNCRKLQNKLIDVGYNSCSLIVEVGKIGTVFDFLPTSDSEIVRVNYKV